MATINTFCDPGTINQTLRVDGTDSSLAYVY